MQLQLPAGVGVELGSVGIIVHSVEGSDESDGSLQLARLRVDLEQLEERRRAWNEQPCCVVSQVAS